MSNQKVLMSPKRFLISKTNKLLGIYITIIENSSKRKNYSASELQEKLKKDFNFDASLIDIENYLLPNFYELRADIEQQMKNLHINYG